MRELGKNGGIRVLKLGVIIFFSNSDTRHGRVYKRHGRVSARESF